MGSPPTYNGYMSCRRLIVTLAAAASAFVFAGVAHASGGNYVFQGGTPYQQLQVTSALNASSFNWSLVTQQITIDIAPVAVDNSIPGTIYLDPSLLNSGQYSWGVVQNEYANQVDFYLLPQTADATFNSALGGTAWCRADQAGLQTAQYGCERFASTLAWAYWQNAGNCVNPTDAGGISGAMTPTAFKALLTSTLGVATETAPATPAVTTFTTFHASATPATHTAARALQSAKIKAAKAPKNPRNR
jgi:hypothetical protein